MCRPAPSYASGRSSAATGGDVAEPARQRHLERRAFSHLREHVDLSLHLVDDGPHGREAEPGALAGFLRRDERIEHAVADLRRDAAARVDHRQDNPVVLGPLVVEVDRGGDPEHAAVGHRVTCVHPEVEDDLFDVRRIAHDLGRAIGRRDLQLDVVTERAAQQWLHAGDDRVQVHELRLRVVALRERQELTHERGASCGGPLDLRRVLLRTTVGYVVAQEFGRRQDRREQVVEVVRDTARELPDRVEPLRPHERVLELGLLDLDRARVGDVAEHPDQVPARARVDRAERREAQSRVPLLARAVAQPQRRFAHAVVVQLGEALPERLRGHVIVGVHERCEAARRRNRLERVAEQIGAVEHLAAAVSRVEEEDHVGCASQDRAEATLPRAQLGFDRQLTFERVVERAVLDIEVPHGGVAPDDRHRDGDGDRREQEPDQEHEERQRQTDHRVGRRSGPDQQRIAAARERHRLAPARQSGRRQDVAEHDAIRAVDERERHAARLRRHRHFEVDGALVVRDQRGEAELVGPPFPSRTDKRRRSRADERGTWVTQQVRVTDARGHARAGTRVRDERHARERRTAAHVGSEHLHEPPRVEIARRDDAVGGREHLVDGSAQALHAQERIGRGTVHPAAIEPVDVVAHDDVGRGRGHQPERRR